MKPDKLTLAQLEFRLPKAPHTLRGKMDVSEFQESTCGILFLMRLKPRQSVAA